MEEGGGGREDGGVRGRKEGRREGERVGRNVPLSVQ